MSTDEPRTLLERLALGGRQAEPIQARPTLYKGIQMRSRLEADYAGWLDDQDPPGAWTYEPRCFAGTTRDGKSTQYLPDFGVISVTGQIQYHEVKPVGLCTAEVVIPTLKRMEVIWQSEPDVPLLLVFHEYGGGQPVIIGSFPRADRLMSLPTTWRLFHDRLDLPLAVVFPIDGMPW